MVIRVNDDNDAINQRAVDKSSQSASKYGFATDAPILLRPFDALSGSFSAASGHNDCCYL